MDIRRMTDNDLPRTLSMINDMYKELGYGPFFVSGDILPRIRSKFFICLLAEEAEEAVGFAMGKIMRNEMSGHTRKNNMMGFIYDLYVRPEKRRTGVAKALLTELEAAFAQAGLDYVELYVRNSNENGQLFWQRSYYRDKYYVMGKELHNENEDMGSN